MLIPPIGPDEQTARMTIPNHAVRDIQMSICFKMDEMISWGDTEMKQLNGPEPLWGELSWGPDSS